MAKEKKTKDYKDPNDDTVLKARLDREWNSAKDARSMIDWLWFKYDLWVSGNHYAKWDKNTQQIITSSKETGRPKIVINKVHTTLRSVRNFALRNRPRAEVTPQDMTEENIEDANKVNNYLDVLHDKLHLRRKLKGSVWHALKFSVGFWQVMWDEDADDGQGEIAVNVIDPYDLYIDPVAREVEEARYMILAVKRSVESLKNDTKYKLSDGGIKGDNLLAASNLKARILQHEKGQVQWGGNSKEETVIVREHWYKEMVEEEYDTDEVDEEGKKKKGTKKTPKIMLCCVAGDTIIRPPEDTGLTRFPFFRLQSDVEPLAMYGEGWVKNLIPVNRLLNRLESSVAEYNDLMNRGRFIADKGSGVRVINNEHGQILEKKRGYEIAQQPITPLSTAIFQQINNANRYIEDIGSIHDATNGRIPLGAKSGDAIEALQVGDSNNLSEIVENIEEFLEDVYEYILFLASQKYQFARKIMPVTETGEREFVDVIGASASNQPEGALVIKDKNVVDVKVSSWIAQTPEARRRTLLELFSTQAIDQATLLKGYEIGNIAQILKSTKQAQLEGAATNIEVDRQNALAQGEAQNMVQQQAQPSPAPEEAVSQAIAAIRAIINGQTPEPPTSVTPEFVGYIDQFIQSEEAQSLPSQVMRQIQLFRDQIVGSGPQQAQA
jgi:hypothetical protein